MVWGTENGVAFSAISLEISVTFRRKILESFSLFEKETTELGGGKHDSSEKEQRLAGQKKVVVLLTT